MTEPGRGGVSRRNVTMALAFLGVLAVVFVVLAVRVTDEPKPPEPYSDARCADLLNESADSGTAGRDAYIEYIKHCDSDATP